MLMTWLAPLDVRTVGAGAIGRFPIDEYICCDLLASMLAETITQLFCIMWMFCPSVIVRTEADAIYFQETLFEFKNSFSTLNFIFFFFNVKFTCSFYFPFLRIAFEARLVSFDSGAELNP